MSKIEIQMFAQNESFLTGHNEKLKMQHCKSYTSKDESNNLDNLSQRPWFEERNHCSL